MVATSTLATLYYAGCGGRATGAAIGAWSKAALGDYSAAKAVCCLAPRRALTEVVAAKVATLVALPAAGAACTKVGLYLLKQAATGTVIGTSSGTTTGYAGGTGNWEAIMTGRAGPPSVRSRVSRSGPRALCATGAYY